MEQTPDCCLQRGSFGKIAKSVSYAICCNVSVKRTLNTGKVKGYEMWNFIILTFTGFYRKFK